MSLISSFLLVFMIFFRFPHSVYAELPPFDPQKVKPDPGVPPAQKLDPIYRGPMEFYTSRFSDGQTIPIVAGTAFGFHLQDLILPYYNEHDTQISTPDLDAMANFTQNFQYLLMPQEVVSKTIHWSPINENIQSNLFCARIINRGRYSDAAEDISSTGLQLSSNFDGSQETFEKLRGINAMLGLHEFESPTKGYYDFNLAKELNSVKDARPFCMWGRDSKEFTPKENDVTQLSTFGSGSVSVLGLVTETIMHIVERLNRLGEWVTHEEPEHFNQPYKVYLTEVTATGNSEQWAHAGDATDYELKNTKRDWTAKLAKSRGVAFAYLPEHLSKDPRQKRPADRATQTEYDYAVLGMTDGDLSGTQLYGPEMKKTTLHPWNIMGNAIFRLKQMACTSVPQELLDKETVTLAAPESVKPSLPQNGPSGTPNPTPSISLAQAIKNAIPINKLCEPPPETSETSGWNCNTNLGELASEQLNSAGQNWADNAIYTDACKTENAWSQCHSDVIDRAKKACIDPIFALTIWLHETGASNYTCGKQLSNGVPIEDFGIHTGSTPPEDFSAQLDMFLKLDYSCPHTIQDWVSMYYIGNNCYAAEPDKVKIDTYVTELQEIYTALGGNTLPTWPKGACAP